MDSTNNTGEVKEYIVKIKFIGENSAKNVASGYSNCEWKSYVLEFSLLAVIALLLCIENINTIIRVNAYENIAFLFLINATFLIFAKIICSSKYKINKHKSHERLNVLDKIINIEKFMIENKLDWHDRVVMRNIVKNLINKGIISDIVLSNYTGISVREIEEIKQDLDKPA